MAAGTLLMFNHFLPQGVDKARTVAFATMSMFELFQLYNMRSIEESLLKIKPFTNKWVNFGFLASIAVMALAFYVPFLANILSFTPLAFGDVALILGLTFVIIPLSELYKLVRRKMVLKSIQKGPKKVKQILKNKR
jgi:Ca2+-transporting ATPase